MQTVPGTTTHLGGGMSSARAISAHTGRSSHRSHRSIRKRRRKANNGAPKHLLINAASPNAKPS